MSGDVKVSAAVARPVAEELVKLLSPVCERIEIVGSLRRQQPYVGDIELLVIPKYQQLTDALDWKIQLLTEGILDYRRNKLGSIVYGPKNKLLRHTSGIAVDIFTTAGKCWPMSLVVRTGSTRHNRMLATRALQREMHLQAYGAGYTMPDGSTLVCHTEADVFRAVGLPYRPPEQRI